jgi:hypothetical protein
MLCAWMEEIPISVAQSAIAGGAGTYTDGRDRDSLGDLARQRLGYRLDHD